ncbi:hypothetical protein E1100_26795, partial [Vibrio owensii]
MCSFTFIFKNENKQLVFVIKTNIENFTNKLKSLFCQLSKLLKSYVSYKLSLVNYQSVWTLIV